MIPHDAESILLEHAKGYPVIALTGPRQSGKTTLARAVSSDQGSRPQNRSNQHRGLDPCSCKDGKFVVYRGRPLSFEDGVEAVPYGDSERIFVNLLCQGSEYVSGDNTVPSSSP